MFLFPLLYYAWLSLRVAASIIDPFIHSSMRLYALTSSQLISPPHLQYVEVFSNGVVIYAFRLRQLHPALIPMAGACVRVVFACCCAPRVAALYLCVAASGVGSFATRIRNFISMPVQLGPFPTR